MPAVPPYLFLDPRDPSPAPHEPDAAALERARKRIAMGQLPTEGGRVSLPGDAPPGLVDDETWNAMRWVLSKRV